MSWSRLSRFSLRRKIAVLLLPVLAVVTGLELWMTRHDALGAANVAYDRSLYGALKSIDANISTASGGLSVELPYRMFEFFELTASGQVYFRVATSDRLVELGSADLPEPPRALALGVPQFYDAQYFGESVRVVAFLRELAQPLDQSSATTLVIQVAESTQSREGFSRQFVERTAMRDAVVLLLTILSAGVVVTLALRPVSRLAEGIEKRAADDLTPLDADGLPSDIRPLVAAVNQHMARTRSLTLQQRHFVDDASHQLRTHLTTLQMQVDFALAEADPAQVRHATESLRDELIRARRSTHQLLTLARSDAVALRFEPCDLAALAREVAVEQLPRARRRDIDLGVNVAGPAFCLADCGLLREALVNLAVNAIEYIPPGGEVTIGAAADASGCSLSVEDNGEGLTPHQRETLGARFVRGPGSTADGSGLGLAIARSIAERHGGQLRLEARDGGGLRARLWWPHRTNGDTT